MKAWITGADEALTPEEATRRASRANRRAVIWVVVILAVIGIGKAWSVGTFDNFLWRVGLNAKPCATNGFGATFCGDDLERYNKRFNTP